MTKRGSFSGSFGQTESSLFAKLMHSDTATCLAGTETGRWELGVMNGIGVMLGL